MGLLRNTGQTFRIAGRSISPAGSKGEISTILPVSLPRTRITLNRGPAAGQVGSVDEKSHRRRPRPGVAAAAVNHPTHRIDEIAEEIVGHK